MCPVRVPIEAYKIASDEAELPAPRRAFAHLENAKEKSHRRGDGIHRLLRINPIIAESLTFFVGPHHHRRASSDVRHLAFLRVVVVDRSHTAKREGDPLRNGLPVPFVYVIRSPQKHAENGSTILQRRIMHREASYAFRRWRTSIRTSRGTLRLPKFGKLK